MSLALPPLFVTPPAPRAPAFLPFAAPRGLRLRLQPSPRCRAPSAPRCRFACGALRVRPAGGRNALRTWLRALVPSPLRLAARPGLRPLRLIPGSAAPWLPSGSTSALRSIPVIRPPPTARMSGSPARPPQTNASASRRRRQSPRPSSRVLARRRRLAQPQRPRPRSHPPRNLRVGSSLAPASCAGGLRCSPRPTRLDHPCSSFARLTHVPMRSHAPMRLPFVRPGTRSARPGAGDGGRGEREGDGTAQAPPRPASCPRPSSARPFARPRPASWALSVTAAASCGRTIRRYVKRALHRASSRHSVGPEHSLRYATSHYISRDCAIRSRVSLPAASVSRARTKITGGKPPPQ